MRKKNPLDWSPRGEIPGDPIWPKFVDAYLEAALWASMDDDGRPLDEKYRVRDFAQKAIDKSIDESNDFILVNRKDLESVGNESQHGHDFWLTRNRHGAGFWDRGYGAVGKRLTDAAQAYGEAYVYAGNDGKLHIN
jgi:hypothetical protein